VSAAPPREPGSDGPGGAARWAAYLDWLRAEMAATVLALDEAEHRTPRVPSGWTPLELLHHCLHMEQRWFLWGFLGERVEEPWGDWTGDEPWLSDDAGVTRPGVRWAVPAGVTAADVAARLAAVGERTRSVLREVPATTPAATGGRFDPGDGDPPTLEWICFHVLAEYARHAGHLDIVVELGADAG
jgi:hypothetical protein